MTTAPTADFLPGIPKIEPKDRKISVLLKGTSGTGKSQLAHLFPPPVFSVYTDPNRRTVMDLKAAGREIDARRVTEWPQFSRFIVPAVVNRQIPASSIVVDTWDFLFAQMIEDIRGSRPMMQIQDWGTVLSRANESVLSLVSATAPWKDHPGYNIIFTCHTKKITDDKGNITEIAPAIQGQFKDSLEAFFDVVLICDKDFRTFPRKEGPSEKKRVFLLRSVPLDPRVETCKSTANWPPVIQIEAGQSGYELLKDYWNPNQNRPDGTKE